ncbi:MAG: glycosyltransferase family 39 protein [Clostridia bacterium]|nr:glycosyltransferase family 39 protein [Clostridia bacterium]
MIGWMLLGMMAAILFSRFLTLTHEMSFHLDEPNIYRSSVSLAEKVLHPEQVYQVALVYPEGSYVMQMPFHLLSRIVGSEWGDRVWARIASVCYYSAGCLTGALCLYRFMGRRRGSVVFFGMLCVFSLFYVEQSRYGTGDPPSFFLLMVLLFACGQFIQTKRNRWLCLAGLCVGALGAVKYPQIYFLLLPAPLAFSKERKWGGMLHFLMLLGCMLAGFLMLSPSLLVWPEYLVESIRRETDAYMRSWSGFTPLENLLELLIYHLLYAEFPLAPVLMLCAAVSGRKAGGKQTKERLDFWKCWVPLVTFIFVVYNLFVGLLVFRTLNPFFAVAMLYSAWALDSLWRKKGWKPVLAVLCGLMIIRSSALLSFMTVPDQSEALRAHMLQSDCWEERKNTVVLGNIGGYCPEPVRYSPMDQLTWFAFPEVESGEFVITAAMEYGYVKRAVLKDLVVYPIEDKWDAFVAENLTGLIKNAYPQWYYSMFGYWLPASSGALFEFPNMCLFYCP